MLITPEYQSLQQSFHKQCPEYGVSGHKWADQILGLANKLNTRSILDYGCGKCTLQKALPFPIQNYDPCIPECSLTTPAPADIVVCSDVMEHIEPDCVTEVLQHLASLTKQIIFFDIATRPAKKFLPDGRNAHLIQEPGNWWLTQLIPHFNIQALNSHDGASIIVIATPLSSTEGII